MSISCFRNCSRAGAAALMAIIIPWSLAQADRSIEKQTAADPNGLVEIVNVAGDVEISAWDRPEVQVTGTADESVDRIDVASVEHRTSITVIARPGSRQGEAQLHVHVPAGSAVSATLVSGDVKLDGMRGDVKVQTVSGDVSGSVGGDVHASTVSGSIRLTAREARMIEIRTINGDVVLTGGNGDVDITTVSGDVRAKLATLARGRFKSVSGDVSAELSLAPDAQLQGESVSGDIHVNFPAMPNAEVDVQSLGGEISNCFGPAAVKAQYGPGSRLEFKNGTARARIRIDTKSGDVRLCGRDSHAGLAPPRAPPAPAPAAFTHPKVWSPFYVI